MSVQVSYPGVYVEEIASGSRSISGASTSITAFIGRALRGSVNEPVRVQSFGDFERVFGGLWSKSTMSYAVQQYFLNGGGEAIIVRIHNSATKATITLATESGNLTLEAANQGAWGNDLVVTVDSDVSSEAAGDYGLTTADLFNLSVYDGSTGALEEFRNVTVADSPRQLDQVLESGSKLVRVSETLPDQVPSAAADTASNDDGSDGSELTNTEYEGSEASKTGIYALEKVDIFNMMCIPPISSSTDVLYDSSGNQTDTLSSAIVYCKSRRAMLIMDPPLTWTDGTKAVSGYTSLGMAEENAAVFFPRIIMPDPLKENRASEFAPCGAIAGVFARTDTQRGIWKAPAGVGATLKRVLGLSVKLTDKEHGQLNPLGVNCLRSFPVIGSVIYGSRTCKGADKLASEFKYIPVRRITLYIEESLYRGTQFAVFEPNDEPLWADLRFAVTSFMQDLFRKGAFQGSSPSQAYFVKCDSETTTQDDINRGIVNIIVGFAPLKPAEFIILKIQQISEQA